MIDCVDDASDTWATTAGEVVLFGLAMPHPSELMDPELERIDKLLDDETLVDAVLERLRQRYTHSRTKGRPGLPM